MGNKRSKLIIKSINSDVSVPVVFVNKTGKKVEMFWYSFDGELTSYGKIPSDGEMEMETFVTHPWSAANAETGEAMLANGQFVFNPSKSHERVHVKITRRDNGR